MDNAFEIVNLNKSYKDFALKNVSLSLPRGYIMGFVGKNGAGKSTTMNCLLGMTRYDSGSIKVLGKPLEKLDNSDRENLGVVIDGCPFAEIFNVNDIALILQNMYKNWDKEKFDAVCRRFSLPRKKPIKEFSTGMRAKLNIATALCHNAQLLVLDEATSGLDPVVRDEILDILMEYVQDENNSVLISSHITSDLEKICDYIAFINNGEIVFVENKDDLMEKYAIIHCKNEEVADIDRDAVIGVRSNNYSAQLLVLKDKIRDGYVTDKPSIEDIMLYFIKEAK